MLGSFWLPGKYESFELRIFSWSFWGGKLGVVFFGELGVFFCFWILCFGLIVVNDADLWVGGGGFRGVS